MDNITISEIPHEQLIVEQTEPAPESPTQPEEKMVVLTDIEISNQNVAFNVLISFITVAQKRGTFSINESAKIWECLKYFLTPEQLASENTV